MLLMLSYHLTRIQRKKGIKFSSPINMVIKITCKFFKLMKQPCSVANFMTFASQNGRWLFSVWIQNATRRLESLTNIDSKNIESVTFQLSWKKFHALIWQDNFHINTDLFIMTRDTLKSQQHLLREIRYLLHTTNTIIVLNNPVTRSGFFFHKILGLSCKIANWS